MRAAAALLLAVALAAPARAENTMPPAVARALAQAGVPPAALSAWVKEVDAKQSRLALNADRPANPASVMKLLTTWAALEKLGPAHTFRTEAWATGPVRNGVLEGDLVLRGGGDPGLTVERLWLLARELRDRGVSQVAGDLVLDRSLYALPPFDPGAFDGDRYRAYNAGADALLVNYSAVAFRFRPGPGGVELSLLPPSTRLSVEALPKLVEGPCGDWKQALGTVVDSDGERARVSFTGRYATSCGERSLELSPLPPDRHLDGVLRALLADWGGAIRGGVRDGPVPAGATLLAVSESQPLGVLLRDTNKWSNNVMARHLYLALGDAPPYTPAKARDGLAALLAGRGLAFPELVVENGAGLSRVARISARHLGELLEIAWGSPRMPEFVASLPIAAEDGTVGRRFGAGPVAGRAHLKTGSIDGVRAVAGYVHAPEGRIVVLVAIINHPNAGAAWPALEAVVEWAHQEPAAATGPARRRGR